MDTLNTKSKKTTFSKLVEKLANDTKGKFQDTVRKSAIKKGLIEVSDETGVNIGVQIIDTYKINSKELPAGITLKKHKEKKKNSVIIVMDYAFGEQAFELMDELLKPFEKEGQKIKLDYQSINIMGKAGILEGKKGDIMIPTAHVFEGSADNYPVQNKLKASEFENSGLGVFTGPMVTVLGTSLQNRDILRYFHRSSWKAIGLEMEGAHYQKAIQAASKIRGSINKNIALRYAYYASDNPLETGSTLASGGLGVGGVKPTYLITLAIIKGILES